MNTLRLGSAPVRPDTPYQAILLTRGRAYVGKLEGFGTPFPVPTDMYYIQSRVNEQTKQVTNGVVKRRKEWHVPDP